MVSSGMLRRVALVRTDFSEELSASFIRVTRIGELGTTLALTSNRRYKAVGAEDSYLSTCAGCLASGAFTLRGGSPTLVSSYMFAWKQ
jgi:hypothetical protein